MGKKQVRQIRQQVRRVAPKNAPSNAQGATRKQRERFVQAGGMLQGYEPDFVIRIGYIAVAVAVVCALAIVACAVFLPSIYGWDVAVVAALAWGLPSAPLASFLGPRLPLALRNRQAEPKPVQSHRGLATPV